MVKLKLILALITITFCALSQTNKDYNKQGIELAEKGQYSEAITLFTLALKENPKNYAALENRALCYENKRMFRNAISDYKEVLTYEKSGITHGKIAYAYLWLDNNLEARKYLEQTIMLIPYNATYLYNLGLTYEKEDDPIMAVQIYLKALEVDSSETSAIKSLARCYVTLKQYSNAKKVVDDFFRDNNSNEEMSKIRGDINFVEGKFELALADYKLKLAESPDSYDVLINASKCLSEMRNYKEEEVLRKRVLNLAIRYRVKDEEKAQAYSLLGISLQNTKQYEDALENLDASIDLDSTSSNIYFHRAVVKANLSDNDGACIDLEKAKELSPVESDRFDQYFRDDIQYLEFFKNCILKPKLKLKRIN